MYLYDALYDPYIFKSEALNNDKYLKVKILIKVHQ